LRSSTMNHKNLLSTVLLTGAAILTGCNSVPPKNATLEEARSNYSAAQSDPQVANLASIEFKQASDALNEAETAWRDKDKPELVNHLAYVANRKALIARETAALKAAEQSVQNADAERNKVLLEARTTEADLAKNRVRSLEDELKAKNTDRGLTITLGDVLFDTGKSQLKTGGMRTLQKLSAFLNQNPERQVLIEGFTDSVGGEEYNQSLSERRADAVRTALVDLGISGDRINTRGYGKNYPVADNSTSAGRQLNRRVEVVISKDNQAITPR
jgi:outer membrane protein OmpA-like peptidoglycan-associated protein